MANTYSDDRGSAQNGGDLGWFGAGRMVPSFEKEAFSLTENGQYSEPFLTQFGWHIVMLEDRRNLGSYEEEYKTLTKKVKGDRRSLGSEHALVMKLMDEYNVKVKIKSKTAFYSVLDSTYFTNGWEMSKADGLNAPLITINDKTYGKKKKVITQKDFTEFLFNKMRNQKVVSIPLFVDEEFNQFIDYSIIEYEKSILSLKYPEYKALVTEYHDGILLFEIMEQEVWKKAMNDSTGLVEFYESTKENYMWEERLHAKIYICNSKENADLVMKMVANAKPDSVIEGKLNASSELGVTIRAGKFEKGKESFLKNVEWKKGVTVQEIDKSFVVVNILEVIPTEAKEMTEVKGLVTSSYQDKLDQDWIEELRSKYTYTIDSGVLNQEIK